MQTNLQWQENRPKWLGIGRRGMTKEMEQIFEGDRYNDLDHNDIFRIISKLTKSCTLNMCSLLYVNYISIKLLKTYFFLYFLKTLSSIVTHIFYHSYQECSFIINYFYYAMKSKVTYVLHKRMCTTKMCPLLLNVNLYTLYINFI